MIQAESKNLMDQTIRRKDPKGNPQRLIRQIPKGKDRVRTLWRHKDNKLDGAAQKKQNLVEIGAMLRKMSYFPKGRRWAQKYN